jgi:hypothetical protein
MKQTLIGFLWLAVIVLVAYMFIWPFVPFMVR